jgi:hypothetical protein
MKLALVHSPDQHLAVRHRATGGAAFFNIMWQGAMERSIEPTSEPSAHRYRHAD